ncbi:hypothetical protein VSDG_06320 [Cytospora chrysosperma]|uniref:FAD-binding domain-containing protein n=1 Tax=Cytospora chrysosperma TaxID=252740 RepID=A0A423VPH4_CYTCH|nr:hypothetical protein VSDG_06320 [Valsa sordida]
MSPLKILIVGGGITGPALAFWLSKLDCDITIVERTPDLRASGQQIDLRGEGVTIMRRMGLEPAVRAKIVDEQGVQFIGPKGEVKAFLEANKTGKGKQSGTAEFEIMRGDLVRILYGVTKDTVKYIFGTSVVDLDQRGDGVHVKFSDGREDDFDLVVGADGQGSRTRRMAWGAGVEDPFRPLGVYISYFTVPKTDKDTNMFRWFLLPGCRAVMTRVDNPKTLQVYFAHNNKDCKALEEALRTRDVKEQKAAWAELLKDAGWEVPRLIDGMLNSPLADDFYFQKVGQVKMDKWSRGRVVLAGDAAHCPSPLSGKGTSLGLVGAYVLAGEISQRLNEGADKGQALDEALASYDRTLRPCVDEGQKLIWGVPDIVYPETAWGIWFLHFIVGLLVKLRIPKLLEWFPSDDNFAGDWKLPDYPKLKYQSIGGAS